MRRLFLSGEQKSRPIRLKALDDTKNSSGVEKGRMGEWENGRVGEWESGRMGEWETIKKLNVI